MTVEPESASSTRRALLPQKAIEICSAMGLDPQGSPLLRQGMTAEDLLRALLNNAQYTDAIALMACALPKREAVWWACVCAREINPRPTPEEAAALEAAGRWVREPKDEHRRAALTAAEATGYATPGGLAAFGAFLSDGSLAPPDCAPVPPAEHLTARAVSGSVGLAAVLTEPEKAPEKYQLFVERGLDIAHRRLRWDQT